MKYILCVTNRVGSSWLCSMLASTGVAGQPVEHFNLPPDRWPEFCEHYQAIKQNDPLGIKTTYSGLMRAIEHVGVEEFRDTPCIWLKRRDTLAQAISNYRAMVTGQWFRRRGEPAVLMDSEPDRAEILRFRAEYEECNHVLWPRWFEQLSIRPYEVWHEDLCEDPEAIVRDICRFLRLPDPEHIDTGTFQVQRDHVNSHWRQVVGEDR